MTRLCCDCGRPRAPRRDSCERCTWLDGLGPAEQDIIGLLREVSEASTNVLADESGRQVHSVQMVLSRMKKRGRIVGRYEQDRDGMRNSGPKLWRLVEA